MRIKRRHKGVHLTYLARARHEWNPWAQAYEPELTITHICWNPRRYRKQPTVRYVGVDY